MPYLRALHALHHNLNPLNGLAFYWLFSSSIFLTCQHTADTDCIFLLHSCILESVSFSVSSDFWRPPWTVVCQASLSMEFSRQESWSGLSFPPPGDLPDPGIEPGSPALQGDSLPSEPAGSLRNQLNLENQATGSARSGDRGSDASTSRCHFQLK